MTSRLASLLVQEGLVAPKQIADAFQRQVIYGGTLDTILLEMNALGEPALVGALTRAAALPAGDTPSIEKLRSADVLAWFPASLAEKFQAVPLTIEGAVLRVLTIDPPDRRRLDELGLQLGRVIEPTIAPEHRFVHAMSMVYDTPVPARFQSLQARLLRRAQQGGGTATPMVAAAASPAPQVIAPAPVSTSARVITDVPMPGAPISPHDLQETPRLTPREVAAPAAVEREMAARANAPAPVAASTASAASSESQEEAAPLTLAAAVAAIDEAGDRDAIFAALCRGARSWADYVALFTVHADTVVGRLALADRWVDRQTLGAISLPLEAATPFRTAITGRSPFMGRVGEDEASRDLLARIGRTPPTQAALVPIVLRDRAVAVLYADASGKALRAEAMGELSSAAGAAARAFQRLILSAKGQSYGQAGAQAQAKLSGEGAAKASALTAVVKDGAGAWRSAATSDAGRLQGHAVDGAPTARHAASEVETDALFASVERGDDQARTSADRLVALGAPMAESAVARLPGPIRIDRTGYRGLTPALADHGPICALIARFGFAALSALERRINEPRAEVRFYVTLALGEIGREQALPLVSARLFDSDPSVRRAAVDTLVRLPDSGPRTAVLESLRGELPGPETDRQRYAAEALGALGDAKSVARLIELVKHDDPRVHGAARSALVAITKQDYGTSRWRWRGWWDRHKNEAREEWLFEGLAHSDDDIRASAAEELRRKLGESFGYNWDAPKREREEARKRWYDWYRSRR